MINKKIIIGISCGLAVTALIAGILLFNKKDDSVQEKTEQHKRIEKVQNKPNTEVIKVKTHNLYSETPFEIPLEAVVEISKASEQAQEAAEKLLETSQGFYFVLFNEDHNKLEILLQNPAEISNTYSRHNLEYAYIDKNGKITYIQKGYKGEDGETSNAIEAENDVWEFDKTIEPYRPIKHIAYDEHNKIKFTETWNYDENEPVKYEMKDSHDNTVSILKETVDNNSNYRKEHVFYDKNGNTETTLSANYDGANISRLTYYSAPNHEGISIISEYSDGNKIKEVVYNQDYELQNTFKSDYEDGKRKNITILDSDSKEIETLSN